MKVGHGSPGRSIAMASMGPSAGHHADGRKAGSRHTRYMGNDWRCVPISILYSSRIVSRSGDVRFLIEVIL